MPLSNDEIKDHDLIIDWEQGIKLAGNKRETAEELLRILIQTLPQELQQLTEIKNLENYPELLKRIHKLHGGLCYCSTPRLRKAAANLESALKRNQLDELTDLFNHLINEASLVIQTTSP
jgi:two-component system, NarL family, sensor histidine kinase BarA